MIDKVPSENNDPEAMKYNLRASVFALSFFLMSSLIFAQNQPSPSRGTMSPCEQATTELKKHFQNSTSTNLTEKNFPENWKVIARAEIDFDSDQQKDQALIINRRFPKNNSPDNKPEQNFSYLVVFLSNKGKPTAVFPHAPTSPAADELSQNETRLRVKENKILEVQEKLTPTVASGSVETATYQWQYSNQDFRLIKMTSSKQNQSDPFPERSIDRNLTTGKEARFDSKPVKDYFYESGEFEPKTPQGKQNLSAEEQEKQIQDQLKSYKSRIAKEKNISILKNPSTKQEWIKIKTETTDTPNSSVMLSKFGSCDFSLETIY